MECDPLFTGGRHLTEDIAQSWEGLRQKEADEWGIQVWNPNILYETLKEVQEANTDHQTLAEREIASLESRSWKNP